ncbi:MAG: hypothetical protein ABEJ72_10105 [Candidatus Aenigmatarchaeota archaeon]
MKKFVMKEWDDRGTDKVKISLQKEGHGIKEFIVPKNDVKEFLVSRGWV